MKPEQRLKYGLMTGLVVTVFLTLGTDRSPAELFQAVVMTGLALGIVFLIGLACYVAYLSLIGLLKDNE